MIVPDKIAPEIGWRSWFLSPVSPVLLSSMTMCFLWPYEDAVVSDAPPSQDKQKGIHAARSLHQLRDCFGYLFSPPGMLPNIIGEVSLWGEVIEGERGFRAERAFPRSLYIATELWVETAWFDIQKAEGILRRYGVPVHVVDSPDDIQAPERMAA